MVRLIQRMSVLGYSIDKQNSKIIKSVLVSFHYYMYCNFEYSLEVERKNVESCTWVGQWVLLFCQKAFLTTRPFRVSVSLSSNVRLVFWPSWLLGSGHSFNIHENQSINIYRNIRCTLRLFLTGLIVIWL